MCKLKCDVISVREGIAMRSEIVDKSVCQDIVVRSEVVDKSVCEGIVLRSEVMGKCVSRYSREVRGYGQVCVKI